MGKLAEPVPITVPPEIAALTREEIEAVRYCGKMLALKILGGREYEASALVEEAWLALHRKSRWDPARGIPLTNWFCVVVSKRALHVFRQWRADADKKEVARDHLRAVAIESAPGSGEAALIAAQTASRYPQIMKRRSAKLFQRLPGPEVKGVFDGRLRNLTYARIAKELGIELARVLAIAKQIDYHLVQIIESEEESDVEA